MKFTTMDKEIHTKPTIDEMFAAYERQREAVDELAARLDKRGPLRPRRFTRRSRRMVVNIVLAVVSLAAFGGCGFGLAAFGGCGFGLAAFGGDQIDKASFVLAAVVSALCFVACTVLAVRNSRIRPLPMAEMYKRAEREETLNTVVHRVSVSGIVIAFFLMVVPVYGAKTYFGQDDRAIAESKVDSMFAERI